MVSAERRRSGKIKADFAFQIFLWEQVSPPEGIEAGVSGNADPPGFLAHLPVPGLRPGCTLEWIVSRRSTYSPAAFPYVRVPLSAGYPVNCARVVVLGALDAVGVVAVNGPTVERTPG